MPRGWFHCTIRLNCKSVLTSGVLLRLFFLINVHRYLLHAPRQQVSTWSISNILLCTQLIPANQTLSRLNWTMSSTNQTRPLQEIRHELFLINEMSVFPAVANIIYSDNPKDVHQNQINGPMTTNSFLCLLKNDLIVDFNQLN